MIPIQGRPSSSFTNLYNYASHDISNFIPDWYYPDNGIDGTGVDIILV